MSNHLEVLAPAGSPEIFYEVIKAGADAVYIGGERFGARAYAQNFTTDLLLEALDFAHLNNKKVYLTVNTLLKDGEIMQLYDYLLPFYEHGLDAVIVQDFGVLSQIRMLFPDLAIHASTQMTVTGAYGAALLKEAGAKRIVCARELSLDEIAEIYSQSGMELEVFVHGALCYSYSGTCLMSSMIGGRSGNRGRCAQPCRLSYTVCDDRKKELGPDAFVLSPKDLCAIFVLPQLMKAGVTSLKIEGRMKQASYAAGVTAIYRKYADLAQSGAPYQVDPADAQLLMELGNRSGFTDGYFQKHNGRDMITLERSSHTASSGKALQTTGQTLPSAEQEKISVSGSLVLVRDIPAKLTLCCGTVTVSMEAALPQKAQNRPLLLQEVQERMQKTGDTPFVFETLQVEMEPDLFLPNGVLNRLRRDAFERLKEELLTPYRRTAPERQADALPPTGLRQNKASHPVWIASTQNRMHLPILCGSSFLSAVYLDCCAYERKSLLTSLQEDVKAIHQSSKEAYLMLPVIFRNETAQFYRNIARDLLSMELDGWVVRNYEEIGFLEEIANQKPVIFDHSLYSYNRCAKQAFDSLFHPIRTTLPLELNRKELAARAQKTDEWIVYGYYPLMTSAQCVCNTALRCQHTPELLYLKDRMGKCFPVRNYCGDCYNVIYNSLPVMLLPMFSDAERMGVGACRLSFTIENNSEAAGILSLAEEFQNGKRTELPPDYMKCYTGGHYKRGVE